MKKIILSICFIINVLLIIAQPTNNPYKSSYGTNDSHWTDSLKWSTIYNVTSYGAIANDAIDDLNAVNIAISAANAAGGGVVYFPSGSYIISNSLKLKDGVILRGDNPTQTDAKQATFLPPSKLEFPKYIPSTSGNGTPDSTAFKQITGFTKGVSNIGIINLDINRARIDFHPTFIDIDPSITENFQPLEKNRNCIVMGIRNNNTAIPDPGVPNVNQDQWHRFSWRFCANIDLYFSENVIVANCRLNDLSQAFLDDSYEQPGYKARNPTAWTVYTVDSLTKFSYSNHYGIVVNRAKIIGEDKTIAIKGYISYPDPIQEPSLFCKGIEIKDNWLFKTMRVGIHASGMGVIVKNNVIRDRSGKYVGLTPDGTKVQTNFSATYENRGIDCSGWNVLIEGNDVQAFNTGFVGSSYRSICGEGILNQGNSGGTKVNGCKIINNKVNSLSSQGTNPMISLYKTMEINNALIKGNTATGPNGYIMIVADQTGGKNILNNVTIDSNFVGTINLTGSGAGQNNFISRNTRIGSDFGQTNTGLISYSCNNVTIVDPNTGFLENSCNGNPVSLPAITMSSPSKDTIVENSISSYILKARIESGIVDSLIFFKDNERLGLATIVNNTASITVTSLTKDNYFTAKAYSATLPVYSTIVKMTKDLSLENSKIKIENKNILVYPVPFSNQLNIKTDSPIKNVSIYNLSGMLLKTTTQSKIDVKDLSKGLYFIVVKTIDGNSISLKASKY